MGVVARFMAGGAVGVAVLSSCGGVRWVHISTVTASSPQATTLHLGLDGCAGNVPAPIVVEEVKTIHIAIPLKLDYDNMKACLSSVEATLTSPVGTRNVVDDHQGESLPVRVSLNTAMPEPGWLPDGWSSRGEFGTDGSWTSTYGAIGGPSISITLASSSHIDQLTGATTVAAATVQGFLPPALTGSVAKMLGQTGPAIVTGYLVVDASGHGHICDALLNNGLACGDPQLSVEWDGPKSSPPDNLVQRDGVQISERPITLSGLLKNDFLFIET